MLVEEQIKHPSDPMLKKRVDKMVDEHGDDALKWPKIGCEALFAPFKKGPLDGGGGEAAQRIMGGFAY